MATRCNDRLKLLQFRQELSVHQLLPILNLYPPHRFIQHNARIYVSMHTVQMMKSWSPMIVTLIVLLPFALACVWVISDCKLAEL